MDESETKVAGNPASTRRASVAQKPERVSGADPKSGPPSIDEWQDFFARFVVKILVDLYLTLILGDFIDELTPAEAERITLSKDDFKKIASPLAEMTNQSSYMRKHGRTVIAASESSESILTLLFWMRSVNRVAKKHRKSSPKPPRTPRARRVDNQNQESSNAPQSHGYDIGEVNGTQHPSVGVYNPGGG